MWPFRRARKPERQPSPLSSAGAERIKAAMLEHHRNPQLGNAMTQLFQAAVIELGEQKAMDLFLADCDFVLARKEMADALRMAMAEAERQGQTFMLRKNFMAAWEVFFVNPTSDTARRLVRDAPESKDFVLSYLVECTRGGMFWFHASLRSDRE